MALFGSCKTEPAVECLPPHTQRQQQLAYCGSTSLGTASTEDHMETPQASTPISKSLQAIKNQPSQVASATCPDQAPLPGNVGLVMVCTQHPRPGLGRRLIQGDMAQSAPPSQEGWACFLPPPPDERGEGKGVPSLQKPAAGPSGADELE